MVWLTSAKVVLFSYTPDIERVCTSAMRSCYSRYSALELYTNKELFTDADTKRMIGKALELGHLDVLEHGSLTYSIEGVSRALTHQLVRHRLASFSQQSQRYVKTGEGEWFITPPQIEGSEKIRVIIGNQEFDINYDEFMQLSAQLYKAYFEKGKHKEDARFALPSAAKSTITITANPREYRHIFAQRCDSSAQWEIQDIAWAMLACAKLIAPNIFSTLDPPAADDKKALEKLKRLDYVIETISEGFKKAPLRALFEVGLGELGLHHEVKASILKGSPIMRKGTKQPSESF